MAEGHENHDVRLRSAGRAPGGHVPAPRLQDIRTAIKTVAQLLEQDERYLLLFLRLEDELRNTEYREAALARARHYLRQT